jgi:hypothetical protein
MKPRKAKVSDAALDDLTGIAVKATGQAGHSRMHWHVWGVVIARSTGSALRAVRPSNLHITPYRRRNFVHAASSL